MASTMPSSGPSATTLIFATVGTIAVGALGYALYFDQQRRHNPDFRRQLKRARKQVSKDAENAANRAYDARKDRIQAAIEETKGNSTMPAEEQEKEFMRLVAEGERMMQNPSEDPTETALTFYKCLKLYPSPTELMGIFDKTLNQQTRELVAEIIALDTDFNLPGRRTSAASASGGPAVE